MSTGLKDEDFEEQYKIFQEIMIEKPRPYYRYDQSLEPDQWFDAAKVMERVIWNKCSLFILLWTSERF